MRIGYLGREDPPEWGMAIHCSILAWKILYRGGAWRAWATSRGLQESDTTEHSTASGRIFEPVLVNACQAYQRMVHEPSIACPLASAAIGPGMGTCPKWTQSSEGKVCITHVG